MLNDGNPLSLAFIKNEFWWFVNWSTLFPTMACWFLLALFVVRLTFSIIIKKRYTNLIPIASVIVAYLLYIISVKNDYGYILELGKHAFRLHIPFYIGNWFHGMFFYFMGFVLKEKQFYRVLFILSILVFLVKFFNPAQIDFRANDTHGSNYMLAVIYELSGCIIINNVFKKFFDYRIPLLTYIGLNSMVYYLIHYPVMKVITIFFYKPINVWSGEQRYIILSLILFVSLIIADRLFHIKILKRFVGM